MLPGLQWKASNCTRMPTVMSTPALHPDRHFFLICQLARLGFLADVWQCQSHKPSAARRLRHCRRIRRSQQRFLAVVFPECRHIRQDANDVAAGTAALQVCQRDTSRICGRSQIKHLQWQTLDNHCCCSVQDGNDFIAGTAAPQFRQCEVTGI